MIPFDRNAGPLCELRPDSLLDNRSKNPILKRVQFTSAEHAGERKSHPTHGFPSMDHYSNSCVLCPVCKNSRSNFFCSGCIRNGDFTHSTVNVLERFAEKKLKFIALKGQQNRIEKDLKERQKNTIQKENMLLKIRQTENSIALLKGILKLKVQRLEETNNLLDDAKRKVLKSHDKQIKLKKGIAEVKNIIAKQNVTISDRTKEILILDNDLQALIRTRVSALTTYVFKIEQRNKPDIMDKAIHQSPTSGGSKDITSTISGSGISTLNDKDDEEEDTPLLLLSDTSNSSSSAAAIVKCSSSPKSAGRENVSETLYYRIGEPWLASNECFGNYFLNSPRLESMEQSTDSNFRCPQYRMLSSLSYVCHVTNLIAIFSNLILPKRVIFSDFYGKNIHRDELFSLIAKVCTNVVYLALFYHVDHENIKPRDMFHNLIILLSNKASFSYLKSRIEITPAFCKQLNESLLEDLNLVQPNFLAFHEANDEPEYDFVENNIPDLNFSQPIVDQSSAGNLISMISSLYKRATK